MYENSARYCINSLSEKSIKSIGYYHSLHSNEFLPYLTNYKEYMDGNEPQDFYTVLAFRANLNNIDRMELEKRRTNDRQIFELMRSGCQCEQ